jgi:hypothetical protein
MNEVTSIDSLIKDIDSVSHLSKAGRLPGFS